MSHHAHLHTMALRAAAPGLVRSEFGAGLPLRICNASAAGQETNLQRRASEQLENPC